MDDLTKEELEKLLETYSFEEIIEVDDWTLLDILEVLIQSGTLRIRVPLPV